MDGNIAVLSPLPKHTQSSESRSVEKKHITRTTISLSTVRTLCCMVAMSWSMRKMKGYPCLVLRVVTWLER